jgi:hypothetical protein
VRRGPAQKRRATFDGGRARAHFIFRWRRVRVCFDGGECGCWVLLPTRQNKIARAIACERSGGGVDPVRGPHHARAGSERGAFGDRNVTGLSLGGRMLRHRHGRRLRHVVFVTWLAFGKTLFCLMFWRYRNKKHVVFVTWFFALRRRQVSCYGRCRFFGSVFEVVSDAARCAAKRWAGGRSQFISSVSSSFSVSPLSAFLPLSVS